MSKEIYDFVAMDFETATSNLGSACQIGIAAVSTDLGIIDGRQYYIRPPENRYDNDNIRLHGITPEITENAPDLESLWPMIKPFFNPHTIVVAHNAHFDMSVLRLSYAGEIPNFYYIDTMQAARVLNLSSQSLEACCDELGIALDQHHDALCDARATAELFKAVIRKAGAANTWEMLALTHWFEIKHFSELNPQMWIGKGRKKKKTFAPAVRPADITPTAEADCRHPLYGKNVVFTGELTIQRLEAAQLACNCGANVKSSVSRKTDYLIVGEQDAAIVGEDGLSTKQETALALNANGKANIRICSEKDFMELINWKAGTDMEQLSLVQAPEEAAYSLIADKMAEVLRINHLSESCVSFVSRKGYYSLLFRLRFNSAESQTTSEEPGSVIFRLGGKKTPFLSVKTAVYNRFTGDNIKEKDGDLFHKVLLNDFSDIENYIDLIRFALQSTIDQLPKEFDCCSRYEECSNQKKCVHKDQEFALLCGYRKILLSGRVFYGENSNV